MIRSKEELQQIIVQAREELSVLEDAEAEEQNTPLLGKCYAFRNCSSLPQSEADYWWLYVRVTAVDGRDLRSFQFQCKKDGQIEIEPDVWLSGLGLHRGPYIPISEAAYHAAWLALCEMIMGFEKTVLGERS